jgi:hypothetical protein
VERLRVVLPGKLEQSFGLEGVCAGLEPLPDREVLEIAFRHRRCSSSRKPRRVLGGVDVGSATGLTRL